MPSFTELQDADNEIVTTPGPNKELGTVAELVKNTNTEAPLSPTGPGAGASIRPILQLKPVPEIVKPAAPTTRRPHTFIRFRKHTHCDVDLYIFNIYLILRRPEVVRAQEFAKPGSLFSLLSPPNSLQDSEAAGGFTLPQDTDNDLSHAWHFKPPVTSVTPGTGFQQISGPGTSKLGSQTIQFKQLRSQHREVKQKQDSGPLTPSRLFEPPNSLTFGFRYVVWCVMIN